MKDVRRRLRLFDALVWTVASYGVEIWGWRESKVIEALQEKYIRWVLGVEWRPPGYMVRKEVERVKMRTAAGRRAWNFEIRLEEGGGSGWARKCWEEVKKGECRSGKLSVWEEERRGYFKKFGLEIERSEGVMEKRKRRI